MFLKFGHYDLAISEVFEGTFFNNLTKKILWLDSRKEFKKLK
jgi:hypothetical protein